MNNPYVGCAPSPFFNPAFAAGAPVPFPAAAPLAGPIAPMGWSIVGADPAPAAEQSYTDKAKAWLNEPSFGVKNGYLLAGAAAVGLTWYGYSQGWFGR
jgi:hypothetical protein